MEVETDRFVKNCFLFVHLQVQTKDVEIVVWVDTIYLSNYSRQITQYNYNIMITQ